MFKRGRVSTDVGSEDVCVESTGNGIRLNGSEMTAEPISEDMMRIVINGRKIKLNREEFALMAIFFKEMMKAMDAQYDGNRMYN